MSQNREVIFWFKNWLGQRKWAVLIFGLLVLGAIGAGLFFRFYNLTFPAKKVFDEVYFPVFANKYLTGLDVFDVHPPLGKFLIALGILGFGNAELGWRIVPAIFGVILPLLMGGLAWKLFRSKVAAALVLAFAFLDGLFITYSRVGLMDGILCSFIMLFPLMMLWARGKAWWWIPVGVALGLAVAVKWPALAVLVMIPWLVVGWKGRVVRNLAEVVLMLAVGFGVYFGIVAYSEYLDGARGVAGIWHAFGEWNWQAYNYHKTVHATHPWSSMWWSWPLELRPVLFLYDVQPGGAIQWMSTLGNPVLWWSSTLAVIWSVLFLIVGGIRRLILGRRWGWLVQGPSLWQLAGSEARIGHPLVMLLAGYLAFWLPWGMIPRVVFHYHYFPSYCFALLILSYWLSRLWRLAPWVMILIVILILASGLYFIPGAVGWWALSYESLKAHIWVNSWLW